jgi:hypothetical protein
MDSGRAFRGSRILVPASLIALRRICCIPKKPPLDSEPHAKEEEVRVVWNWFECEILSTHAEGKATPKTAIVPALLPLLVDKQRVFAKDLSQRFSGRAHVADARPRCI